MKKIITWNINKRIVFQDDMWRLNNNKSVDGLGTNIKKLTENFRYMKEYKTERPRHSGKYSTVSQKHRGKA